MSLNNIKVKFKILAIIIIAVLGISVVGLQGIFFIKNTNAHMEKIYNEDLVEIELLNSASSEEIASSIDTLARQAADLQEKLSKFVF